MKDRKGRRWKRITRGERKGEKKGYIMFEGKERQTKDRK